jgi:hypothetical protein
MRLWLTLITLCLVSQSQSRAGQVGVMVLGAGQRSYGQFIAAVVQAPVGAVAMIEKRDGSKLYGELIRTNGWRASSQATTQPTRPPPMTRSGSTYRRWICGCGIGATLIRRRPWPMPARLSVTSWPRTAEVSLLKPVSGRVGEFVR